MSNWRLTDSEWDQLHEILVSAERPERRGRPRTTADRVLAEACLYHYFHHSETARSRSFGWNDLPEELGVSGSTANRRFREWMQSGAWTRFWDALVILRQKAEDPHEEIHVEPPSPVHALIAELERAYRFFNTRFFGGTLPTKVAIAIERNQYRNMRALGYFCGSEWRRGAESLGHLVICASALGQGAEFTLEVLLHEMVHLRNDQVGLPDCDPRNQYHNRRFRDVAILVGLECAERHPNRGYGVTHLAERGKQVIRDFGPNEALFEWEVGKREDRTG